MTTAQNTRRAKTRALTGLLAAAVAAATLVSVSPTATAEHDTRNDVPNAKTITDHDPDYLSRGDWGLFAFQGGVRVSSSFQLGLPA